MTSAQYRNEARQAQASLNWAVAADLYGKAIAAYPIQARKNSLAEADLESLSIKQAVCLRMAAN